MRCEVCCVVVGVRSADVCYGVVRYGGAVCCAVVGVRSGVGRCGVLWCGAV